MPAPSLQITLPPSLKRRYEVRFLPLVKDKALPLRKVGAHHVGKMVTCKVSRADERSPSLLMGVLSRLYKTFMVAERRKRGSHAIGKAVRRKRSHTHLMLLLTD